MGTLTHDRPPSGLFVTVGPGLEAGSLEIITGGVRPYVAGLVSSRDELRARAAREGWRHVWMTPAAAAELGYPAKRKGWIEADGIKWRCAGWEIGSPFAGVTDHVELFEQLWSLEAALGGVGWMSSGAVTSDVLLRALHRPPRARAIGRTVLPPPAVKAGRGRAPGGEAPFMWHRPPAADRGGWVHHFDLNGAYLAAASKLRLPQGDPIQLHEAPAVELEAARKIPPGYWRLEVEPWGIETLPAPWGNRPKRDPELWVTTPTLRILREIDWPARVIDGWYWLDSCEALTPWYERLRDARANLAGPAREAIKQIYRQGIGRLASELRTKADDPLYQPAWAHHVIAESRARIWRRCAQLARMPLAVEVDSIWIQHEAGDPLEAAADARLPIGDGLGQWKPLGRLAAEQAHATLCGPPRGVFARLRELEHG